MQIEDYSSNINLYIQFSEIWYCVNIIHIYESSGMNLVSFYSCNKDIHFANFHSMGMELNEIVLWEVYKNCFIFFISENLIDLFLVLSVHIQIKSMHTEFKHLINERHNFITILSWQSKEDTWFVPHWEVTMLTNSQP